MSRLDELLLLWEDKRISPGGLEELKMLLQSPEARARATVQCYLSLGLSQVLQGRKGVESEENLARSTSRTTRRAMRSSRRRRWGVAAGVAAGILVAVALATWLRPGAPAKEPSQAAHPPVEKIAGPPAVRPESRNPEAPDPVPPAPVPEAPPAPKAPEVPAETRQAPEEKPPVPPPAPPPAPGPVPAPPAPKPEPPVEAPRRQTVAAVARLGEVQGDVFVTAEGARAAAREGADVLAGQVIETAGVQSQAALFYPGGTWLRLEARTQVRSEDGHRAFLVAGKVQAEVTPAKPFTLLSAESETTAAGANLSVALEGNSTRLEVEKGTARLVRRADGAWVDVRAGQFAVAAPGVPFQQGKKKEPVAGHPKVDQKKVDEAIRKGIEFLKGRRNGRTTDELVLWTYLHAGVPEDEPAFKALLDALLAGKLTKTYNTSLQAMILEKLDRVKYQVRIYHCAQFLADNQWSYGEWGYGAETTLTDPPKGVPTGDGRKVATSSKSKKDAPPDPKRVRFLLNVKKNPAHDPVARGDNSNSQYAALGVRACHDAGIRFERDLIERAMKSWRDLQKGGVGQANDPQRPAQATGGSPQVVPQGWTYGMQGATSGTVRGSMTVGGIGSLVIYNYMLERPWKADIDTLEGIRWVADNFTVSENPGGGKDDHFMYYYLYGLERAGILYGTEFFGPHEWYPTGANFLLQKQNPNGSWVSMKMDPIKGDWEAIDTCFAILFLKRATRPIVDVASVDRFAPKPSDR